MTVGAYGGGGGFVGPVNTCDWWMVNYDTQSNYYLTVEVEFD